MARRRWIDPSFWDDLQIAKLRPIERLFFIGCFSNADDEGRLIGNPAYLRATIFKYDDMTLEEITEIRDNVVGMNNNLVLYSVDDEDYLAFRRWNKHQKPNYPKESQLPTPPFVGDERSRTKDEPKSEGRRPDDIGRVGQGRVRVGQGSGNNKGSDVRPRLGEDADAAADQSLINRNVKERLLKDLKVRGKAFDELLNNPAITALGITEVFEEMVQKPTIENPVGLMITELKANPR